MLARFISSREDAKFLSNSHEDTKPQSFFLRLIFSANETDICRFPPLKKLRGLATSHENHS